MDKAMDDKRKAMVTETREAATAMKGTVTEASWEDTVEDKAPASVREARRADTVTGVKGAAMEATGVAMSMEAKESSYG